MKTKYTSAQLIAKMNEDLAACHTPLERNLCRAMCEKEIKAAVARESRAKGGAA